MMEFMARFQFAKVFVLLLSTSVILPTHAAFAAKWGICPGEPDIISVKDGKIRVESGCSAHETNKRTCDHKYPEKRNKAGLCECVCTRRIGGASSYNSPYCQQNPTTCSNCVSTMKSNLAECLADTESSSNHIANCVFVTALSIMDCIGAIMDTEIESVVQSVEEQNDFTAE